TVTWTEPELSPWHLMSVIASIVLISGNGSVTSALYATVHPFASETWAVYTPAARFTNDGEVSPLFHRYLYGSVPPVAEIQIAPVFCPAHSTWVTGSQLISSFSGCSIVAVIF